MDVGWKIDKKGREVHLRVAIDATKKKKKERPPIPSSTSIFQREKGKKRACGRRKEKKVGGEDPHRLKSLGRGVRRPDRAEVGQALKPKT